VRADGTPHFTVDAVVELSLAAWAPVFANVEQMLGSPVFRRIYPDWAAAQAAAVRTVCTGPGKQVWVAVTDNRPRWRRSGWAGHHRPHGRSPTEVAALDDLGKGGRRSVQRCRVERVHRRHKGRTAARPGRGGGLSGIAGCTRACAAVERHPDAASALRTGRS
jgi:hypothetical protein